MTVLWWIANAILLFVVIPLVAFLATRIISLLLEIRRYAADIREHGTGIADNLAATSELARTKKLVGEAAGAANRYASAIDHRL